MVRPSYDLNSIVQDVPIFSDSATPGSFEHLGAFAGCRKGGPSTGASL
jgi:hypothetical protein